MSPEGHQGIRRPASFRGAGLFSFFAVLALLPGCQPDDGGAGARSEEEARALGLRSGAVLHRVNLGGRGSDEHAVPTVIQASPGDGVEFVSVDHRVHTVEFLSDSLTSEVRTFLEATGQMASPPLVDRGSRFVLKLQNAPHGRYFFRSEGHGGMAHGVVEVGKPPSGDSSRASPRTGI